MRLLWDASRPLTVAAAAYTAAASVLPDVVLIAAGHVVGAIPAAAASGLHSAAGRRLIAALAITWAVYAGALLRGRCRPRSVRW